MAQIPLLLAKIEAARLVKIAVRRMKEDRQKSQAAIEMYLDDWAFHNGPITKENVADAVKRFRIEYPIALDSENVTWKLYGNQYWPRQTLIDVKGRVRWEHAGEGAYDEIENRIRELLKEV